MCDATETPAKRRMFHEGTPPQSHHTKVMIYLCLPVDVSNK